MTILELLQTLNTRCTRAEVSSTSPTFYEQQQCDFPNNKWTQQVRLDISKRHYKISNLENLGKTISYYMVDCFPWLLNIISSSALLAAWNKIQVQISDGKMVPFCICLVSIVSFCIDTAKDFRGAKKVCICLSHFPAYIFSTQWTILWWCQDCLLGLRVPLSTSQSRYMAFCILKIPYIHVPLDKPT